MNDPMQLAHLALDLGLLISAFVFGVLMFVVGNWYGRRSRMLELEGRQQVFDHYRQVIEDSQRLTSDQQERLEKYAEENLKLRQMLMAQPSCANKTLSSKT